MRFFRLLVFFTYIVSILNNNLSGIEMLFGFVSMCLILAITAIYPFSKHIGKYTVLLTFWISLAFMPAFHLVVNLLGVEGARGYIITGIDYQRILYFGSRVLILSSVSWLVLGPLFLPGTGSYQIVYNPMRVSTSFLRISLYFMFALSLFSLSIGLSRMGTEGIQLPFNLAGIITLLRVVFYPIFFAAVIENFLIRGVRVPKDVYVLYILWAFLETFVRLSKSAILSSFLVVALVLLLFYKPKIRTFTVYLVPIVILVLSLYPIVDIMRSNDSGRMGESFVSAFKESEDDELSASFILQPLNRTFMIPHMYAKDYSYVDQNHLFDFSRSSAILAIGGAARFQTFIIDDYPPGVAHSSGTTGLEDPLLFGGYGLCYIVVLLLILFASMIDLIAPRRMYTVYVALILLLWNLSNEQNITSLIDSVGLQYIFVRLLAIFVAYYMNNRKRAS